MFQPSHVATPSTQPLRRRTALQLLATLLATTTLLHASSNDFGDAIDQAIQSFMRERNIPGGAIAIVKDSRLVLANGYGFADREKQVAAKPTSRFRIASLSKPITALGILKLIEDGKLGFDTMFYDLLKIEPFKHPGQEFDERIRTITIRQLLQHTGGWDPNASFDPMFAAAEISTTLDIASPPSPKNIIHYMLGRALDFEPGTKYSYSNFGYCILGRIIEHITGDSYEHYIQENILKPCGADTMQLGRTLQTAENEVRYYMADDSKGISVFSDLEGEVSWPYGGFCLESMDAHGGWVASANDLAHLMAALGDPKSSPILNEHSFHEMFQAPPSPMPEKPSNYYGCGWDVRRHADKTDFTYDHSGSLPGTMSVMFHRWDGISWIVLFNQRSDDDKLPDHDIERIVNTAIDKNKDLPEIDLFD